MTTEAKQLYGGPLDGLVREFPQCPHGHWPALNLGVRNEGLDGGAPDAPAVYEFVRYEYDRTAERYQYVGSSREG
jgi:hypothetical protein